MVETYRVESASDEAATAECPSAGEAEEPGSAATEPEPTPEEPFLEKARAVLLDHVTDPLLGTRLGRADAYGPHDLFRKFKAAVDRSPGEDLREQRLQRAAELLRVKAGNVAEVTNAAGFAIVSAVSRRFGERFGDSPAACAVARRLDDA